jgi:hypothetical protein
MDSETHNIRLAVSAALSDVARLVIS